MNEIKDKGFVSGIYVCVNFISMISFFALASTFFFSDDKFLYIAYILFLLLSGIIIQISQYLRAPAAYRRFAINATGIRCGNIFIKHEDVDYIKICRGYVNERFGFQFFENITGVSQHNEVYVEELICINCSFIGYNRKASKRCIYIPKNKKTDMIMKAYCVEYVKALEMQSHKLQNKVTVNSNLKLRITATSILCLLLTVFLMLTFVNGLINIYKMICLFPIGILLIMLLSLKPYITDFIYQWQAKNNK